MSQNNSNNSIENNPKNDTKNIETKTEYKFINFQQNYVQHSYSYTKLLKYIANINTTKYKLYKAKTI